MGKRGPVARLYDALNVFRGKSVAVPPAASQLRARTGEQGMARMGGGFGQAGSGPGAWQFERAEQVRHYRHWVYRCVDFISTQATREVPSLAYAVDPDAREKHWLATKAAYLRRGPNPLPRRLVDKHVIDYLRKNTPAVAANEDLEFAPPDHPLIDLLRNPNGPNTGVEFFREFFIFLEMCGASYVWKVPGESGRVAELWVVPAHWVRPVCLGTDRLVDYYEVRPWSSAAAPLVRFAPEEMAEVKYPNPLNKLGAMSPLQATAEIVDQYDSIMQARYWSLKNGANVGAVLQQSDAETYPTDEELDRLEAKWLARFQGEHQFLRPVVLPRGLTLSRYDSAQEIAFLQSSDQIRDYVISTTFGLTKTALGIMEGVNRAAFVAAVGQACYNVVNPKLAYVGAALTEKLAYEYDPRLRLFWPDLTPNDPDAVRADYAATPGAAVSVNEYRQNVLHLEPFPEPEYDRPMSQAGMIPGGNADDGGTGFGDLTDQIGQPAGNGDEDEHNDDDSRGSDPIADLFGDKSFVTTRQKCFDPDGCGGDCGGCEDDRFHRWATKAGYTGRRRDSAGRTRCYDNGKLVPCGGQSGQASGHERLTAARSVLSDPGNATPEQWKSLSEHLQHLTADELKAVSKEYLKRNAGKVKQERVNALVEWAKSQKKDEPKPKLVQFNGGVELSADDKTANLARMYAGWSGPQDKSHIGPNWSKTPAFKALHPWSGNIGDDLNDGGPNGKLPDSTRPSVADKETAVFLNNYSWGYDGALNEALRKTGQPPPGEFGSNELGKPNKNGPAMFAALQKQFAAAGPLGPPPAEVTRGLKDLPDGAAKNIYDAAVEAMATGRPATMPGFVSTSTRPGTGEGFADGLVFKIRAVHGLDMRPYSHFPTEDELLLNHNSKFLVTRAEKTKDGYVIHLDQLPPKNRQNAAAVLDGKPAA